MSRFATRLLLVAMLLAVLSAPAAALAAQRGLPESGDGAALQGGEEPANAGDDELVDPVVIWSIVGLGVFAVVMGAFYYFKRQIGGFPENPTWVAPITIMQSKDFPDERDFGEQAPPAQGHAGH